MADWIILLGGRGAAIDAANDLGLNVFLIAEPKTPLRIFSKAKKSLSISLRTESSQLSFLVLEQLNDIQPVAVIAVSEQGVLPAAYLRKQFGLIGQSVESAFSALNKSEMKKRFLSIGLPCWLTKEVQSVGEAVCFSESFQYPLVVKALSSSGSRGFRVIKDRTRLRRVVKSMLDVPEFGGVGIEPYCSAEECSVELVLHKGKVIFSNITDYLVTSKVNLLPAKFSNKKSEELLSLAQRVVELFDIEFGMVHIEFYCQKGLIWIGEINARPPGGGLMDLMEKAYGMNLWRLVIESQVIDNLNPVVKKKTIYAANWIIHPGKGIVQGIRGLTDIESHPLKTSFQLKVKVGQSIRKREGTGESVGQLTMVSSNYSSLKKAILFAMNTLQIILKPSNER